LICTPHAKIEEAWVYQAIRGYRSEAEELGVMPWDTLPGVEPVASDCLNCKSDIHTIIRITVIDEYEMRG
jgi:hypothetical protein